MIRSGWAAKISVKLAKLTNIKAGTYILDPSWEVREIFEVLNDSHGAVVNDTRLTFIEGDWAKHIAEKIGETTRCSKDEMLALWNDESYVRSLMSDYPFLTEEIFNADSRILLEGYLFPETYNFFVDADADQITRKILDQTLKVYNEFADQFAQSQLSEMCIRDSDGAVSDGAGVAAAGRSGPVKRTAGGDRVLSLGRAAGLAWRIHGRL